MKNICLIVTAAFSFCIINNAYAAKKELKVKVKLASGADQVNAITSNGKVFPGKKAGNTVTIQIPTSSLQGTSFYATNGGRLVGPVIAPVSDTKGMIFLSKKPKDEKNVALTALTLKLKPRTAGQNYLSLAKPLKGSVFEKKTQYTLSSIFAYGFNSKVIPLTKSINSVAIKGDADRDGVVDSLDIDADGDGISNIADSSTIISNGISGSSVNGIDVPFTALYLSLDQSINYYINNNLTTAAIDAVIGGENKFSIAYFFTLPPGDSTGITGGHITCGSELSYCRPGDGTAVYSGFSEGNQSLPGNLWSSIQTDGNPNNLEVFNLSGTSELAYAASIQPRTGTAGFRPGDNYQINFTSSTGEIVSSKTLTLPPYFLTVPALYGYEIDGVSTLVNYSDQNSPGMNNGNPIVLSSNGATAGKLKLSFYRLQRLAVPPDESSQYMDHGNLNYGVLINNQNGEFTCGELYSNLSSNFSESPSRGSTGGYGSHEGALLWPLVDSASDSEVGESVQSILNFTVDLTACRVRNGLSAGVHRVTLIAAGADTGKGANRAGQMFTVNIP